LHCRTRWPLAGCQLMQIVRCALPPVPTCTPLPDVQAAASGRTAGMSAGGNATGAHATKRVRAEAPRAGAAAGPAGTKHVPAHPAPRSAASQAAAKVSTRRVAARWSAARWWLPTSCSAAKAVPGDSPHAGGWAAQHVLCCSQRGIHSIHTCQQLAGSSFIALVCQRLQ
jgi:hypothetical protein